MSRFGKARGYGRHYTDEMRSIDVRRLQREGALKPGAISNVSWTLRGGSTASIGVAAKSDHVRFIYRNSERGGPWKDVDCRVELDRTPMHFGGEQTWWRCPCCHRRVALLYVGRAMACRHCWNLAYRVEQETDENRAFRRVHRIRSRLGWSPNILNGAGDKPKGMHWRTFLRLRAEHDAHVQQVFGMLRAWLRG